MERQRQIWVTYSFLDVVLSCTYLTNTEENEIQMGRELVQIGYSDEFKAYHLLDPVIAKVFKARDVVFFEDQKWNSDLQEYKSSAEDDSVQAMAAQS